ncbi:SGNH/GDSL hydrolase family protein [Novipirellula rosea]|uniref:Tetratricopeptide repeat protein n=1 Tax=Novipirellula rosea TaxID=1031540 RepID=A0ABP8MQ82_9BACT
MDNPNLFRPVVFSPRHFKDPSQQTMSDEVPPKRRLASRQRRWLFPIMAILVGMAPVILIELSLRMAGWRPRVAHHDPFVDFQTIRPLFVLSDDGENYVTAANRLEYFQPESFAATKSPDEFRIVCLGGSTVQGRPYSTETSFTTWLELSLQAADPSKRWEVINCGGVSYASYRLVPILEEMLRYEPDLIVLATGHNEFLEDRSYAGIKNLPDSVADAYGRFSRLRISQWAQQLVASASDNDTAKDLRGEPQDVLATEVDALLDYQGGLAAYHRDAAWQQSVVKHFGHNLRRMIDIANTAAVPILLVDLPVNLRDCPPFKSEDTTGISDTERRRCEQLVAKARTLFYDNTPQAIKELELAVGINPQHAGLHYQLALLYFDNQQFEHAKRHFQIAIDQDICPLRIVTPVRDDLRHTALEAAVPMVPARQRFETLSPGRIPGDNLLLDHVHPTIPGHQWIASEIISKLEAMKIVSPRDDWLRTREQNYARHWETLTPVYFARGKQRLKGLQLWSEGRAKKIRDQGTRPADPPHSGP